MDEHFVPVATLATIKEEARQAGIGKDEIGQRVHAITLQAIQHRSLNRDQIKAVLAAVSDGVHLGLSERGGDIAQSLRAAVNGMDQALVKFTQSMQLMVEEALAGGREFRAGELQQSLQTLRDLETLLVDTLRQTADSSAAILKTEMNNIVTHLKTSGSDAGRQALDTLTQLASRLQAAAHSGKLGVELGLAELASRAALFASGLLTGAAEALRNRAK